MFIRIRRGLGLREIFLATIIGVGVSLYSWTPILREQAEKVKQKQNSENSQSGESQQTSNETTVSEGNDQKHSS